MRIQELLAQRIHELTSKYRLPELMFKAFDVLPEMKMTRTPPGGRSWPARWWKCRCATWWTASAPTLILPYPPGGVPWCCRARW